MCLEKTLKVRISLVLTCARTKPGGVSHKQAQMCSLRPSDHWGLLSTFPPRTQQTWSSSSHDLSLPAGVWCGSYLLIQPCFIAGRGWGGVKAESVGSCEAGPIATAQGTSEKGRQTVGHAWTLGAGSPSPWPKPLLRREEESDRKPILNTSQRQMDLLRVWLIFSPSFCIMAMSGDVLSILPKLRLNRVVFHMHFPCFDKMIPVTSIYKGFSGGLNSRPEYSFWGQFLITDIP